MLLAGLNQDRLEEGPRDGVLEQAPAVLGEAGMVEGELAHIEAQEPLEEQVVLQPLAELALAANRVERHQQAALEQVLGRDRGPAILGVHGASKVGARRSRARSTMGRTRRMGCSAGTSSSGVTALSIESWRTVEPRMQEASRT